jgi:hypothetical protein
MKFKLTANPIGEVKNLADIDDYVNSVIEEWKAEYVLEDASWWQWWKKTSAGFAEITAYILNGLDSMIKFVDNIIESGPDKKATVMASVEKIYDFIVTNALPLWLRPWNPAIKAFIFNIIISYTIDFIVDKYNNGIWSTDEEGANEQEEEKEGS